MIAVFAVVILFASAGTAHAIFGGLFSKLNSPPLDPNHTISIASAYGTAVASCKFVGAWGNCTASCPSGYSRTGCSAGAAINSTGLTVSPAENGCTCAVPDSGLCLWGSCPTATCYAYCLQVPTQSQSDSLPVTVSEADDGGPNTPTLASIGQCMVGISHSITMQSTDSDNDNIRYGVDWDADGSVDQFVPPSGYVPSGISQIATRTYSISGTKTVKVMAQDENGLSSDWATLSFFCADAASAPPIAGQCTDATDNDGDGLVDSQDLDCTASGGTSEFTFVPPASNPLPTTPTAALRLTVPSLVARGKTVQVVWSADYVSSCLPVSGTNGDSFAQLHLNTSFFSPIGGRISAPIIARTTYSLICIDLNGVTRTKTAIVNIQPNFRER